MRLGGLQKVSLIDYPGKVACVIFTQGCNFRCGYCHNPGLVLPETFSDSLDPKDIFAFLHQRKKYLQGVVVSGGEPTIHADLIVFLSRIKELGFAIKLDTNGSHPQRLQEAIHLGLLDFIAMDIKAPLHRYEHTVGVPCLEGNIKESMDIVIKSGIEHEFRATVVKSLCAQDDLAQMAGLAQGGSKFRLQKARLEQGILDPQLISQEQYTDQEMERLKQQFEFQSV